MSRPADQEARKVADRHYSRQTPGALLAPYDGPARAVWVSRFQPLPKHRWVGAWECSMFRNEGAGLSSELIREAIAATRYAWGDPPDAGFLTFVKQDAVRPKRDPGYCFLMAGFHADGETKHGLLAFVLPPEDFPAATPAHGQQQGFDFAPHKILKEAKLSDRVAE